MGNYDPFDVAVGERLRIVQQAFGRTAKEMADIAGCSEESWRQYCRGRTRLSTWHAAHIRRALRVTIEWMIVGDLANPPDVQERLDHAERNPLKTRRGRKPRQT